MDKDVGSHLRKLCARYTVAQADLEIIRAGNLTSTKRIRAAQVRATAVVNGLRSSRRPGTAALIKLAYVRGLREVSPKATLSPWHERNVETLLMAMNLQLGRAEAQSLQSLWAYMRRLNVARTLARFEYPDAIVSSLESPKGSYPLEQHAHAILMDATEKARQSGLTASGNTSEYDAA